MELKFIVVKILLQRGVILFYNPHSADFLKASRVGRFHQILHQKETAFRSIFYKLLKPLKLILFCCFLRDFLFNFLF